MITINTTDIEKIRKVLLNHTGFYGCDDAPIESFHRLVAELHIARSRALPQLPRDWIIRKLEDFGSYATCELYELTGAVREAKGEGPTIFAAIEAAVAHIGLPLRQPPVAATAKKNAPRRRRSSPSRQGLPGRA